MQPGDTDHKALAIWAADCAERTLPLFHLACPDDPRALEAIEAARAWARGEISVADSRVAAFAAHAAAREAQHPAATAAARSAGHAAATAHVSTHATHAAAYARKALSAEDGLDVIVRERQWQRAHLLQHLRPLIFPDCDE